jgi:hypothetical protein
MRAAIAFLCLPEKKERGQVSAFSNSIVLFNAAVEILPKELSYGPAPPNFRQVMSNVAPAPSFFPAAFKVSGMPARKDEPS